VTVTRSLSARQAEPRTAPAHECHVAQTAEELARHFAIRRDVFVDEQGIFAGDDHDLIDDDPATLHVVAGSGAQAGGTVRLYPLDEEGLWQGDRLAVLPAFRHGFLGADLVRFAVATAGDLGGRRMVAMIQLPNVRFFKTLGWTVDGPVEPYHGVDHQPMSIALSRRFR
jgi:putative N-acetyltransferase (TIGR04045 family)